MLLKIFNGDDQQIYIGPTVLDASDIPDLTGGEIVDIEYTLMTRTEDDAAPWALVDPGGYSLQIGLFAASDRTQLAYQNTWSDDAGASKKTGQLALDTTAVTTALQSLTGVSAGIRCVFEVRTVDVTGANYPYRNKSVTLIKPFITNGTLTVPATETALTMSTGVALFVPKDGSNAATPCDQFILKTRPSGLSAVVWIADDGTINVDIA